MGKWNRDIFPKRSGSALSVDCSPVLLENETFSGEIMSSHLIQGHQDASHGIENQPKK